MKLNRTGKKVIVRPYKKSDYQAWKTAYLSILPKQKNPWDIPAQKDESKLKRSDFDKILASQKKNRSDDYFFDFGIFLKDGTLIGEVSIMDISRQVFQNAYLGYRIFNNHWGKGYGKEAPTYLIELKKKYTEKRDQAFKASSSTKEAGNYIEGSDFLMEKSIKKPIYILIDANCASSCESTTDFFEYNDLVKTVGENTAGHVHFGNNGSVFLKNSGIKLQMATSYNSYVDGRFIEKTGITPKIQVPPGKNAMDFAWDDFSSHQSLSTH